MRPEGFPHAIVERGERTRETLSVAVANVTPERNKTSNLNRYEGFIQAASAVGAGLIVFPEQALQGYLWQSGSSLTLDAEVFRYQYAEAETTTGPSLSRLCEWSRLYDIHIVMGFTEAVPAYGGGTGALFNSLALIGGGRVVGVYRKVHRPGAELHIYRGGRDFPVFETPFGRLGLLVCYDIAFPEVTSSYAIRGADILIFSTAWTYSGPLTVNGVVVDDYQGLLYDTLVKSRAAENQMWLIAADCTGTDAVMPWRYYGHSRVISPGGIVLAEIGDDEGLLVMHGLRIQEGILAARTQYFGGLNILADRRPELYTAITDAPFGDACGPRREAPGLSGPTDGLANVD